MSYNIEDVEITEGSLALAARDVSEFLDEDDGGRPESCFLEDMQEAANRALRAGDLGKMLPIEDLSWAGTWSGNSFDLFKKILGRTRGSAKIAVTWEDGAVTGLLVDEGEVREVSAKKVIEA